MRERPEDPLADELRPAPRLARAGEGARRQRLLSPARISVAGVVELVPDVPEEHAARPAVLDVSHDALAVRLLPVLDRLEPRVDLPDRLVAEVEQVGVEERQVVVRRRPRRPCSRRRPCHACWRDPRARSASSMPSARTGKRATSPAANTFSCPDHAPVLVHDDSVVDFQAGRFGELGVGDDAEPGDDARPPRARRRTRSRPLCPRPRRRARRCARRRPSPVVVGDEPREAEREEAEADPRLREEHRHAAAAAGEAGRDLRADEAAADHDDARVPRARARAAAGSRRASGTRSRPRRPGISRGFAPGGEQELLPRVLLAGVVRRAAAPSRSSETIRRPVTSSTPSAGSRQSFSSGAPCHSPFVSSGRLYGGCGSAPIIDDRAVGVVLADALRGHVAGHPGADDEVLGRVILPSSGHGRTGTSYVYRRGRATRSKGGRPLRHLVVAAR